MCWLLAISTSRQEVYRPALLAFFVVCVVAGVPLSWPKKASGDVVTLVGFELLQRGISQRRAAWFIKWTRTAAEQETLHMTKFAECLGRVMHVTGVHWSINAFSWLLYVSS